MGIVGSTLSYPSPDCSVCFFQIAKRHHEATGDVESPAELAQQLDPDDHEGWEDHTTWQTAQKNLYLAKAAISFYDAEKVVV